MSNPSDRFALPDSDPIERVVLHIGALPLVEVLKTSFGGHAMRTPVFVELHMGGAVGWGECVAAQTPDYSYETVGTAVHVLRDFFIPAIVGQRNLDGLRQYRGHPMARMAVEAAYWSAVAKRRGVALGALLGENRQARVEVGVSIGIQPDMDATLAVIEKRINEGYRRIKLKIKPGWDIDMLRVVRRTYPNLVLMADANSAYMLDDVLLFRQMDALNLLMIEQPLGHDDIYQHSKLQPQLQTPICLDESIRNADDARLAIEINAGKIINLKPGRVGGIVESLKLHAFCQDANVPLWIGGMLETGIGRAVNLAIASLPGVTLPSDLSATNRYFDPDITNEVFTLNREDSTITVPSGVGSGVTINIEQLARAEVAFIELQKHEVALSAVSL